MSFDQYGSGLSPSTLDDVEAAMPTTKRPAQRRRPRNVGDYVATLDAELDRVHPPTDHGSGLGDLLVTERPFVIDGDVAAFISWMERENTGALLEVVAETLADKIGALGVRAVLDLDDEDPPCERALLLARVAPEQADALDRFFEFTASEWWMKLVRSTGSAIIVDIQRG